MSVFQKNKRTNWNEEQKEKNDYKKHFLEFLYTENDGNQTTRLVDFIVATNASAKQALVSALLEEAHSRKLNNPESNGTLIGIFGKPGTGKSHAFKNIFEPYLSSLKESQTLKKGAFIGSAALNIESLTLHSQLGLRILNNNKNSTNQIGNMNITQNKRDKIKAWIHVLSLMIDEISQISAVLLSQICVALCTIKECQKIFGNINMFFFGDFYQMESISTSLFRTLKENNKNTQVVKGRGLWRQLEYAIFLDEPQRSKDKLFSKIKRRIRNGCCQKEDVDILNTHTIQTCSIDNINNFQNAPFYTTRHYEIDHINEQRIYFHSLQYNKQVIKWQTPIYVNGKKIFQLVDI